MKIAGQVGNVRLMQRMNRLKVLNYIIENQPVARPTVAKATGLSLSSITNIVTYLMSIGLVDETGVESADRVGRKATLLRFCSESYYFVCVNIELNFAKIVLTDLKGTPVDKRKIKIDKDSQEKTLNLLKTEIKKVIDEHTERRVLAIGVSTSAMVLNDRTLILSSSLKWTAIDIKQELESKLSIPTFIGNISINKAISLLHRIGLKHSDNIIFLDLDNGIGAVHFYKGSLSRGVLGEIGHTTVDLNGPECFCGNRGCLEALCSVDRIKKLYNEKKSLKSEISYNDIKKAYESGDGDAKKIICEISSYLGIGIANIINLFNPDRIFVNGGELLEIEDIYIKAVEEAKSRANTELFNHVTIEKAETSDNQEIEGIAINLCEKIFDIDFKENIVE